MKKFGIILSLCLMAIVGNVKAQDATLQETMDFITTKIMGRDLWYSNYSRGKDIPSEDKIIQHWFSETSKIELENKKIIVYSSDKDYYNVTCTIDLSLVKSIDRKGAVQILLTSNSPFITVKKGNEIIEINKPTELSIAFPEEDAPRLFKAFKHLFKLLNISLVGDKF